jgi:hypoxanthine phosphoribosyltransferase
MPLSDEDMYKIFGPTSCAPDELGEVKQSIRPKKQYYSWDYFHTLVGEVKKQIKPVPSIIVSIGKGGSIPGVILAEAFNCTNLNLGLRSYKGQTRDTIQEYQGIDEHFDTLKDANVLIIDDIADSGETFNYAVNKFKDQGCVHLQTASVFYKPCSKFRPDCYGLEVSADTWIVQPWEPNQ